MTTREQNTVDDIDIRLLPGEKPTLKTISRLSGMAVPTVSRALGDAPDISLETKAKVRRIADKIGYVPNRAGVRLRTGRTYVIALVLSTEHDVMNMTARLISSIADGLRGSLYHLVVTPDFPDEDPMKAIRYIVETGSADAIIMNQIRPEDPRVDYLMKQNFAFVTHGRTVWSDHHAFFDYDNRSFGKSAIEQLAKRGRKKILMIAPPLNQNYAIEMIEGALSASKNANLNLNVLEEVTSDSEREDVESVVSRYISKQIGYDALISASPNATMAAISGIEKAGHTVGDEVDVFSKETVPFLKLFRPKILCISEDIAKAGEFLARSAIHAAEKREETPMQFLDIPQ